MSVIVEKLSELHGDGSQADYFLFFEQGHMAKPLLVVDQYEMEHIVKEHGKYYQLLLSFLFTITTTDLGIAVKRLLELMNMDIEWDDWEGLQDALGWMGVENLWHDSYSQ